MSKVKSVFPRLTLKTARELAIREVGTASGLKKSEDVKGWYEMSLGRQSVTIRPSDSEIGLFELRICSFNSSILVFFFHPDTLEEDFDAEDRHKMRRFRDCVEHEVLRYDDVESIKAAAERTWKKVMKARYPYTFFDEDE